MYSAETQDAKDSQVPIAGLPDASFSLTVFFFNVIYS